MDSVVVRPGELGGVAGFDSVAGGENGGKHVSCNVGRVVDKLLEAMLLMLSRRLVVLESLEFSRWKGRSPRKM